jgi:ATP-dependent Clp protease ATP-binding subunit ClpA
VFGDSEGSTMLERFTDSARAAIRAAFQNPTASERTVVTALTLQLNGVARQLLTQAEIQVKDLSATGCEFERKSLIELATVEAKGRHVNYVGTQHLLLAMTRSQSSEIARLGLTSERLERLLLPIEAEERLTYPVHPLNWGYGIQILWRWIRGHA